MNESTDMRPGSMGANVAMRCAENGSASISIDCSIEPFATRCGPIPMTVPVTGA